MIPAEHVVAVCKPGQKAQTCAYLSFGLSGTVCAKAIPPLRLAVEARLADGTMRAKGDNCPGWLT